MNTITMARIRKEVATLANKLNKSLKSLSDAFKKAWTIIKGKYIISKVSGVVYGNRQRALMKLEGYSKEVINVSLERETENKYDSAAIKVMVSVGLGRKYHLGYLPKDLAALLSTVMDKGIQLTASFKAVTGGYKGHDTYGALIAIEL